jgi:predicted acyltransferase (DUF342 family)
MIHNKSLLIAMVAIVASLAYAPTVQAEFAADGTTCTFHTTAAGTLGGTYGPYPLSGATVICYDGAINITSDMIVDTTYGDVTFSSGGALTQAVNTEVSKIGGNNILWPNHAAVVIGADTVLVGDVRSYASTITIGANSEIHGEARSSGPLTLGSLSEITGDVESDSYVTLGALSKMFGHVESRSYVSLGASSEVHGNVNAVAYVTTGALSTIYGNIDSQAAVTLGAGSQTCGSINTDAAVTMGAGAKNIPGCPP